METEDARASESEEQRNEDLADSRRQFLKTAGKLAAYTPPAMLVLMQPSKNAIAGSPGAGNGPWGHLNGHPAAERLDAVFRRILDRLREIFARLNSR